MGVAALHFHWEKTMRYDPRGSQKSFVAYLHATDYYCVLRILLLYQHYDEDWRKLLDSYYILYFHANTTAQEPGGGKRDREPYHQNGNEKNKVPNCSRACVLFVISLLTNAAATVLYHMIVVLLPSRPLLTISAICKCAFWKGSFLAFWTIT